MEGSKIACVDAGGALTLSQLNVTYIYILNNVYMKINIYIYMVLLG